jgi:hypothetical protein
LTETVVIDVVVDPARPVSGLPSWWSGEVVEISTGWVEHPLAIPEATLRVCPR